MEAKIREEIEALGLDDAGIESEVRGETVRLYDGQAEVFVPLDKWFRFFNSTEVQVSGEEFWTHFYDEPDTKPYWWDR